jgi:hypothetical protein
MLDYAVQEGATIIYIENLKAMRSGGLGKKQNVRLSEMVRGLIFEDLTYFARLWGIAVTEMPPEYTSSYCPMCLGELTHVKGEGLSLPGYAWAVCLTCGYEGDRDYTAAVRIGSRGLASQNLDTKKTGKKYIDVPMRCTLTPVVKTRKIRRKVKVRKQNMMVGRVVLRDKTAPTPSRPKKTYPARIKGRVSTAGKRPVETSCSLKPTLGWGRQAGFEGNSSHAYKKRMQYRGFQWRLKPSWVKPRPTPTVHAEAEN